MTPQLAGLITAELLTSSGECAVDVGKGKQEHKSAADLSYGAYGLSHSALIRPAQI